MKITKADLSDVEQLAELNKRLIEDERHPNPMNVQQLAQRMAEWLQGEYTCYLATEDRSTVAYCLFRDDGKYYYMRQLFVERAYRRKGIASRLLDWMYQNVWTDKKVRLDVLSHNEEAIAFYKAYGFRVGCLRMEK
jgi:ribosomal protein S18 acetylase RimI-like enzyme